MRTKIVFIAAMAFAIPLSTGANQTATPKPPQVTGNLCRTVNGQPLYRFDFQNERYVAIPGTGDKFLIVPMRNLDAAYWSREPDPELLAAFNRYVGNNPVTETTLSQYNFSNGPQGHLTSLGRNCLEYTSQNLGKDIDTINEELIDLRYNTDNHARAIDRCTATYNELVNGGTGHNGRPLNPEELQAAQRRAAECIAHHEVQLENSEREKKDRERRLDDMMSARQHVMDQENLALLNETMNSTMSNLMDTTNQLAQAQLEENSAERYQRIAQLQQRQQDLQNQLQQMAQQAQTMDPNQLQQMRDLASSYEDPNGALDPFRQALMNDSLGGFSSQKPYLTNPNSKKNKDNPLKSLSTTEDLVDPNIGEFKPPQPVPIKDNPALGEGQNNNQENQDEEDPIAGGGGGGSGGAGGLQGRKLPKEKSARGPYLLQYPVKVNTKDAPQIVSYAPKNDNTDAGTTVNVNPQITNNLKDQLAKADLDNINKNPPDLEGRLDPRDRSTWVGFMYLLHRHREVWRRHRSDLIDRAIEIPKDKP